MGSLHTALVAFQAECESVPFDSLNPHFKSRFASLSAIHKAIKPLLAKHGLAVLQFPVSTDGRAGCVTRIIHESGESMEETLLLPLAKNDPQGAGAAVSYARRYGLSGALGIVTEEDDDGEAAQGRAAAVAKPMQRPAPRAPKPASPMSNANKTKLAYAARERIKELGDDSIGPVEIIRSVAKAMGYASEIELTDDDFGAALSKVQTFDPGEE
jgi:hypothetical protein